MTSQTREPGASQQTLTASTLVALGLLSIMGPLGTDAFLPGLPAIGADLGTSASMVQLALTGFAVGMALGQLVAGPLSDAVGRRWPLLVGAALMTVAAALGAAVPSIALLMIACLAMGLAGSVGLSVSRAVVSDLAVGSELARGYSLIGTMMSLGPILGPVIGVVLLTLGGWRAIFLGLAAFAAICLLAIALWVPESHPPHRRLKGDVRVLGRVAIYAFRSRYFLCAAFVAWASFMAMFAYVGGSPFVVQNVLGYSSMVYALVFAAGGVGLVGCSLLAARLTHRFSERRLMALGLGIQGLGAVLIGLAAIVGPCPWLLLPGMLLVSAPMVLIAGPSLAFAIRDLRHAAGTAIAVLSAVQWLFASFAPPLVSLAGTDTIVPFAVVIAGAVVAAWLSWWLLKPADEPLWGERLPTVEPLPAD